MAITTKAEPCPTCGELPNPAARWREEAGCLTTHEVCTGFSVIELAHLLAHRWKDDRTYAAVRRYDGPFSDTDALAWLERCHAGEVERRPVEPVMELVFDEWED